MTTRQQLKALLDKTGQVSENAELDSLMGTVLDGFVNVLNAANQVKLLFSQHNRQVNAGHAYEATLTYDKLLKARKIHDDLVKFWTQEMSKPEATQTTLF